MKNRANTETALQLKGHKMANVINKTATYAAKFGHQIDCAPGEMVISADSVSDAIEQALLFVADGYRNGTWINVDLGNSFYSARNVHGQAVGELTTY
jgi:hypothetical protein